MLAEERIARRVVPDNTEKKSADPVPTPRPIAQKPEPKPEKKKKK